MIKTFLLACACFVICFSCNSNKERKGSDSSGGTEKNKKITKRDRSVTEANAYNDLFFDSLNLVKFITANQLEDAVSRRMTSFYNARNYQYAWFASNGLSEQARGFWNLHKYHTANTTDSFLDDKRFEKQMDNLAADDELSISAADKNILEAELKMTQHFILYALNNIEDGYLKRKELERFIPRKKESPMYLADSLLTKKHKDNKYYEDVNESYKQLKLQLQQYVDIARQGGWPVIEAATKQLKKGAGSSLVLPLKKRLSLSGDMAADTIPIFDDALTAAIRRFQVRHGYTPNGNLSELLIRDMNVPVEQRIRQILINMGRTQWMIVQPKGKLIVVNIPEFILHVKDGDNKVFDMVVVVGKEGHNTTIFTGNMNHVVFSPYWNVPVSIVKKELQPAIEKDQGYLAKHNMEITGTEGGLPVIRQLPGEDNSLGRVKFLFPNSFDIYFHDTPAKGLFSKDKRAYSHGCIRLSDPMKMAQYVLKDQPAWTEEKIKEAMHASTEKYVKLKDPIPVMITYYTAWVDENGLLHFADDVYGHDKDVAEKMFL